MGLLSHLFGNTDGQPVQVAGSSGREPTNLDTGTYLALIDSIRTWQSKREYHRMLECCAQSLPLLPSLVRDCRRQYGAFDISSIPAIEVGCRYWAALGDGDSLRRVAEAVDQVAILKEEWGDLVQMGDPGVGKTCVLRAFRKRLPEAAYRLTYCHNVTLGRRDFYRQLCIALGLSPSVTAAGVFHAVATHVNDLGKDRIHPVFLLDEAHLLHQDTLDHLHILLNYEWDSRALLSLVMVGLPELLDRLSMRRNRSLFSRLHRRLRIDPLSAVDTGEYIGMRLHRAGCERELFASDAIAMIHEAATGGMRDADRLATAALREAARKKRKLVERDALARTIDAHTNGDTGA